LPSIIRIINSKKMMDRARSPHWKQEESIPDFGGKTRMKEITRKTRGWKNNIKMDIKGIG
jgi:hypothetical protein